MNDFTTEASRNGSTSISSKRVIPPTASFVRAFAEDADQPTASADLVVSVLALHYVEEVASVLSSVERWLVDGGVFVMVVEHPLVTAVKPRPDRENRTSPRKFDHRFSELDPNLPPACPDRCFRAAGAGSLSRQVPQVRA